MNDAHSIPGGEQPLCIALIVATDLDGVIGRDNRLPWHLPADLQRFKRLTMGKPMIMGRRTYESIGKPLPGRTSIVLTGQPGYVAAGCLVARTVAEALELAGLALAASRAEHGVGRELPLAEPGGEAAAARGPGDVARAPEAPAEIMVIGGEAVFREFLPLARRLYWTQVLAHVGGDVRLPPFSAREWREVERSERPADEQHAHAVRFVVWERIC
jgi:dihydrofolate reductase